MVISAVSRRDRALKIARNELLYDVARNATLPAVTCAHSSRFYTVFSTQNLGVGRFAQPS